MKNEIETDTPLLAWDWENISCEYKKETERKTQKYIPNEKETGEQKDDKRWIYEVLLFSFVRAIL